MDPVIAFLSNPAVGGTSALGLVFLYLQMKELKDKVKQIENDYVTCKYCNMQHDNLNNTLKSMDSKLDTLIEKIR